MIEIKKYQKVADIPKEWDSVIGDNLYLSIEFLAFIERVEDYGQKYYAVYDGGKIDTVFMTYQLSAYNMAMFTKFNLPRKTTMVYIPLSVSRPSIAYGKHLSAVFDYLKGIKGPKMVLNLGDLKVKGYAKGLTCPKCILTNRFSSFDGYMSSLRSGYRRRYKTALNKSANLTLEFLDDNQKFSEEEYACYLQVYEKSQLKLEKLPIEFFRGKYFKIFTLKLDGKSVGFCQLLPNGDELIFEFVGVDYAYNDEYDVYHRILLEIVRYGIENGFKTIDFGQTADESKLKLGAKYVTLYAYLHDSNPIMNCINKMLAPVIEYKPIKTEFNVFKENV